MSSLAVFEAAMLVKFRHLMKSCGNQKKREIWIFFYINLHLKDRLHVEFTACWGELMPQETLTSFTIS